MKVDGVYTLENDYCVTNTIGFVGQNFTKENTFQLN